MSRSPSIFPGSSSLSQSGEARTPPGRRRRQDHVQWQAPCIGGEAHFWEHPGEDLDPMQSGTEPLRQNGPECRSGTSFGFHELNGATGECPWPDSKLLTTGEKHLWLINACGPPPARRRLYAHPLGSSPDAKSLGFSGTWKDYLFFTMTLEPNFLTKWGFTKETSSSAELEKYAVQYLQKIQVLYRASPHALCTNFFTWLSPFTQKSVFLPVHATNGVLDTKSETLGFFKSQLLHSQEWGKLSGLYLKLLVELAVGNGLKPEKRNRKNGKTQEAAE